MSAASEIELLPLGTSVRIDGDEERTYVLIARGVQKDGDGFLAGYKGVVHPQGAGSGRREVVIRGAQITTVVHRGYEDRADAEYARELVARAAEPVRTVPSSEAEPVLTVDLSAPPVLAPAPSPAPPSSSDADLPGGMRSGTPVVATDPFRDLRRKGKQS